MKYFEWFLIYLKISLASLRFKTIFICINYSLQQKTHGHNFANKASTVISILLVAKSDETTFQSRTKQLFWARVGTIGFGLKFERSENFNEANRAHLCPEKLLCSRLKRSLITFRY